ncbi:hypothetical protein ACJJTC_000497 [Scirpophaga incertulas]
MEDIEDDEFVASEHDLLVSTVSKLDKTQHIREPTRNEPTNRNTEFNLFKRSNKLDLKSVVKVLEDTSHHVKIAKKILKSQNASTVLPKPLEKPVADRIKRATGYDENKKKIGRWDPVVARSRTVDYVSFPLKHTSTKLVPTKEFLSKFKLKSPLEKELDEIEPQVIEEEEEDNQIYPMSYEEMVEHRQHLAKLRAQQSYNAAKAKRQSKIKSKKYHRILKKEKLKQQLKEFEELQKKDPEQALQKLEALEKARALERHTLRHKSTGKWAKNKLIRAKYDKDVRQQIADQLAVSRSLTHKVQDNESSDDEVDNNIVIPDVTLSQDPKNPWMLQRADKSNIDAEFDFGYKKYLNHKMYKRQDNNSDSESENNQSTEMNILKESISRITHIEHANDEIVKDVVKPTSYKTLKKQRNKLYDKKTSLSVVATSSWKVEPIVQNSGEVNINLSAAFDSLEDEVAVKVEQKLKRLRAEFENSNPSAKKTNEDPQKETDNIEYLKFKNKKTTPIIDEALIETNNLSTSEDVNVLKPACTLLEPTVPQNTSSDIDPTRFIEVKPKYLNSAIPNIDNENDDLDDEQVVPKVNIEEVFEEDDVVDSFRQEKEDEINKDKPSDIDLSLPGWGSWGGKGVKAPKRKRNRFILKAPPKIPRRDEHKGEIIINEYKDPKLASHKVTNVPFPFASVKEYEASIRTPIGNTFIPEKAHKKLIRPSIITKAGTIIEPMDEEELLVPKNRNFKNDNVIKLLAKK